MPDIAAAIYCPHCGTENPPYEFRLGSGQNLQMSVQLVTVVCGGQIRVHNQQAGVKETIPCRRILSVGILALEVFAPGALRG